MPTDRFYRLPEEKKKIIREAAIKEFARVPYEKASINKIIKNADISRGSFYTYFEDKKDVINYIFEAGGMQMAQYCKDVLEASNGDYFQMLREVFEYTVHQLQNAKEMIEIARNVMPYQDSSKSFGFDEDWERMHMNIKDGPCSGIFERLNRENWRIDKQEELECLLELGFSSMMLSIMQFYKRPDQLEEIRSHYWRKIEILQYGVYTNTKTE